MTTRCQVTRQPCARTCTQFDGRGTRVDGPPPLLLELSHWCQEAVRAMTEEQQALVPAAIVAEATR